MWEVSPVAELSTDAIKEGREIAEGAGDWKHRGFGGRPAT